MRGRGAAPIALSLVGGLVQAASFWPFEAWWLQLAALATLVVLVLRAPGHAFRLGLVFGLGCFAAGVSWLYVSMHRYGGMPAVLASLALLLFATYLASFFAVVCVAFARLDAVLRARGARTLARAGALAMLFAGAWSLAEILRGWLFTGFPWLAIGYAQLDGPLDAFAPLLGVYGVCLFAALVAFGLALAVAGLPGTQSANDSHAARAFGAGVALLPIVAGLALTSIDWSSAHGAPLRVRLLQGNVAQDLKFDPRRSLEAMYWYTNEFLRGSAPLTVLPETAWTIPWPRTPQNVHDAIVDRLQRTGGAVAIGMPLFDDDRAEDARLTNSVGVIDASGAIAWRYDKRHLVPFGEFVPFGFGWFVDLMHIPLGDFARGSAQQRPLKIADQRIAFDICYEDLFGEEIAAQVRGGASILVNISNIAWFGDSHALPQHLQIARMRTLELARPMLRATNTGVTAAIDARGQVLARLPPYTAAALDTEVQGTAGTTPYARFGNVPIFVLSLGLIAAGLASTRIGARATRRSAGRSRS